VTPGGLLLCFGLGLLGLGWTEYRNTGCWLGGLTAVLVSIPFFWFGFQHL